MNTKENTVDFDDIKDNLLNSLVQIEGNEDWLNAVPHKEIEDLALIYKIRLEPDGDPDRMTITNDMVKMLGMSEKQFMEAADAVIPGNEPPVIKDIREVLGFFDKENDEPGPLYVATNPEAKEGAGVINYHGFLDHAAEQLNGDFTILPSSIHEVLLLKDNANISVEDLKDIVMAVNDGVVDPKDQLSNQVYHYDSRNKIFELAEKFEERKSHAREEERPSVLEELRNNKDTAVKDMADKAEKSKKISQEASI